MTDRTELTCGGAARAMRIAERAELRGEGDSPLAAHVRSCASCRRVAIGLEAGTDLLAEMVAVRNPAPDFSVVQGVRHPGLRRAATLSLLPIAAAIIGVIALERGASHPKPASVSQVSKAVVSVDVSRGQTATVLATQDPTVTIVWLTTGGNP